MGVTIKPAHIKISFIKPFGFNKPINAYILNRDEVQKGINTNISKICCKDLFERAIAEYAGSKYAVAIDNCTDALFLCLKYLKCDKKQDIISIPKKTYASIPMVIHNAGCRYKFEDVPWSGLYQLKPYPIYDSALRLSKGCYIQDSFQCISFHRKKILKLRENEYSKI